MKLYYICITIVILLAVSCKEESSPTALIEDGSFDALNKYGLFGTWEIEANTINGITGGAVVCCEFIKFKPDGDQKDQIGLMSYEGNGLLYQETFEVLSNDVIRFTRGSKQYTQTFSITENQLSTSYNSDGVNIEQTWVKR